MFVPDGVPVDATVEHGVQVDRELCASALQEGVEICRVTTAVVSHLLQVLKFSRKST